MNISLFNSEFEYMLDPQADDIKQEPAREPEPIFSLYNVNTGSLGDILNNTLNSSHNSSSSPGTNASDNAIGSVSSANVNTQDFSDDSSDDCVMIGQSIPLPLNSTSEGLIKRDNDKISNDIPFITTVCCMFNCIFFNNYRYKQQTQD